MRQLQNITLILQLKAVEAAAHICPLCVLFFCVCAGAL